jgi:hypothetical protein
MGKLGVDSESFRPLIRQLPDLQQLQSKLETVIQESFVQDALRVPGKQIVGTKAEIKHRTEICLKWFRVLRGDMGYTVDKALDFLSLALRKELDGESWEPPKDVTAWGPDALKRIQ